MQVSVGSRLGPYQIVSRIGAGGMGEVWKARDTRLERDVAIKILPEDFALSAQLRLRFEREAKTISQLNHPHICTLHDVGEDYLVMELLEGESLADRIARGPLPLADVLRYGAQIAEALDRAHRAGIVHRDLKPANVMLTKSGAKLLDFGLAKSGSAVIDINAATQQKPLTAEGTILGTFQYMSPEQLEGMELDGRSDIFSLGVLLYEMTTGQRAFEGTTKTSLIAAIIRGEPRPINETQPLTPPALEHVIRKSLAKSPEDRWQSVHDVAEELKWIGELGSSAGVAAPIIATRKRRERLGWMVALLLLLPLAIFATWRLTRVERRPVALSIVPPQDITFAFTWGTSGSLTISPDGRHVTFPAVSKDGRLALYLRSLDSLEAREIPGTAGSDELFPFWSPDSRSIAFFSQGKLKRVDLVGSPPVVICDAPKGRSGDWNEEGTIIFSPDSVVPIHRVSATGGKPVPVTTLNAAQKETTHRWATFLPDGRRFIYMAGTHIAGKTAEGNAIYLASLDGGEPKLLLRARSNVVYSDGHLLYVREQALLAQPFDEKRGELTGDPFPVVPRVEYVAGYFRATFSASRNGTLVYRDGAADTRSRLVLLDRSGKQTGTVGPPADIYNFTISPDGKRVAVALGDESGLVDMWIHDLKRDVRTRFTFGSGSEHSAVWSPDGRAIAYTDERRGLNEDVYMKPFSGGASESMVVAAPVPNEHYTPTAWSPDSGVVLANHRRVASHTELDVVSIPMRGDRKPKVLVPTPAWDATFSPDGRWIAYLSDESGRDEVYVTRFPDRTAKWQVSNDGVLGYRWNGKEIFFGGRDRVLRVVDIDVSGDEPVIGSARTLFPLPNAIGIDVMPDGQQFLVNLAPDDPSNNAVSIVTNWNAKKAK